MIGGTLRYKNTENSTVCMEYILKKMCVGSPWEGGPFKTKKIIVGGVYFK